MSGEKSIEEAVAKFAEAVEIEYVLRVAKDNVPFVWELHQRHTAALAERLVKKHELLALIHERNGTL